MIYPLYRNHPDYFEFSLDSTGRAIQQWRKRFFRKNSKRQARIELCWRWPSDCPEAFSVRFIRLVIGGEVRIAYPITREAFDTLKGQKEPEMLAPGFYVLPI